MAMSDAGPSRSIVLVGLMGAGKTNIGRRLANRLHLPFIDADSEIEAAAGATIEEIFQRTAGLIFAAASGGSSPGRSTGPALEWRARAAPSMGPKTARATRHRAS